MHSSASPEDSAVVKSTERVPSKYNIANSGLGFIRSQIEKNVRDLIKEVISVKVIEDKNTLIIKINLERATDDNFKVFNDFISYECDFSYDKYIIDLSKALFLDSTFLGCIVVFYKKITQKGKKFNLIVDKEKVKILQPFENLEKILNVKASVEEALDQN